MPCGDDEFDALVKEVPVDIINCIFNVSNDYILCSTEEDWVMDITGEKRHAGWGIRVMKWVGVGLSYDGIERCTYRKDGTIYPSDCYLTATGILRQEMRKMTYRFPFSDCWGEFYYVKRGKMTKSQIYKKVTGDY